MEPWKKELAWIGLFIALMVVLLVWNATQPRETFVTNGEVGLAGTTIRVAIADTPALWTQGLSGTPSMPKDAGMLFVFDTPDKYGFWMKDMNFPLDIIWLDELGKVIYMKKDALPSSYPESFGPALPAKYVLEVNAGFAEQHGLMEGDQAVIDIP
ncbi:DUF192 domain-containing protein [Candidatus Parcubacteria bacterium]|nr:DUF192 domain-containing protein [Candidatus Parcubacteria bacterium]